MILRTGNRLKQGPEIRVPWLAKDLNTQRWILSTKRGLTLVEVLLAVSILAIGVISVLRAYANAIATLQIGQHTIDATGLLKQKMADVEQMVLEAEEISPESERGAFESPFEEFLWEWEIKPAEIEGLNKLTLMVSHSDNPRIFALNTYVVNKNFEKKKPEEE